MRGTRSLGLMRGTTSLGFMHVELGLMRGTWTGQHTDALWATGAGRVGGFGLVFRGCELNSSRIWAALAAHPCRLWGAASASRPVARRRRCPRPPSSVLLAVTMLPVRPPAAASATRRTAPVGRGAPRAGTPATRPAPPRGPPRGAQACPRPWARPPCLELVWMKLCLGKSCDWRGASKGDALLRMLTAAPKGKFAVEFAPGQPFGLGSGPKKNDSHENRRNGRFQNPKEYYSIFLWPMRRGRPQDAAKLLKMSRGIGGACPAGRAPVRQRIAAAARQARFRADAWSWKPADAPWISRPAMRARLQKGGAGEGRWRAGRGSAGKRVGDPAIHPP